MKLIGIFHWMYQSIMNFIEKIHIFFNFQIWLPLLIFLSNFIPKIFIADFLSNFKVFEFEHELEPSNLGCMYYKGWELTWMNWLDSISSKSKVNLGGWQKLGNLTTLVGITSHRAFSPLAWIGCGKHIWM